MRAAADTKPEPPAVEDDGFDNTPDPPAADEEPCSEKNVEEGRISRTSAAAADAETEPPGDGDDGSDGDAPDPPAANEEPSEEMPKPRKWVVDRCYGTSKYGESHPPLRCCTVPPCVACCPDILEQNCICESIGRLGVASPDNPKARKWLMRIGLVTQLIGMTLTAVACFAISTDYGMLSSTAFTLGNIRSNRALPIRVAIGLRAVAIDNPNPGRAGETVVEFGKFCSLFQAHSDQEDVPDHEPTERERLADYLEDPEGCSDCHDVSSTMVASLILSLVTYFPTIFTDVLRMYQNYDVNCQKAFGFVFAIFGLGMAINTWTKYANNCVNQFYDGNVPHDANGYVLARGATVQAFSHYDFDWKYGPGLICLVTATFLKCVDIICHFLLPTPSITRNHQEQAEYEKLGSETKRDEK